MLRLCLLFVVRVFKRVPSKAHLELSLRCPWGTRLRCYLPVFVSLPALIFQPIQDDACDPTQRGSKTFLQVRESVWDGAPHRAFNPLPVVIFIQSNISLSFIYILKNIFLCQELIRTLQVRSAIILFYISSRSLPHAKSTLVTHVHGPSKLNRFLQ